MNSFFRRRDRMMKVLNVKYANILRDDVELFKSMCLECQKNRKRPMDKGIGCETDIDIRVCLQRSN